MSVCPNCGHERRFHDLGELGACRVGDEAGVPCGCTASPEDDELVDDEDLDDDGVPAPDDEDLDDGAVPVDDATKTPTEPPSSEG